MGVPARPVSASWGHGVRLIGMGHAAADDTQQGACRFPPKEI